MWFLGIDPAATSGFGLLESVNNCLFIRKVGRLKFKTLMPINLDLIETLFDEIKILSNNEAILVSIESQYFEGNPATLISLVEKRRMFEVLCCQRGWPSVPIAPSSWRSVVGIKSKRRDAIKAEARAYVRDLFKMEVSEDASEAVCIAVALWAQDKAGKKCSL